MMDSGSGFDPMTSHDRTNESEFKHLVAGYQDKYLTTELPPHWWVQYFLFK